MPFIDKATAKTARFEINAPQVAHEVIADEAMIIDFDSGAYYSVEGTGAEIWVMACSGDSGEEITAALAARYRTDSSQLVEAVDAFVRRLAEEGLLRPAQGKGETVRNPAAEPPLLAAGSDCLFQKPHLRKDTDMEDLLLLDPIHDVNEHGWPQKKADQRHG